MEVKKTAMKRFKFICMPVLLFLVNGLSAQILEVTDAPPITPQNLITNVFLGDGVEVVSVVYQGADEAVGYFKNGDNAVGLNRGIVMTTGRAVSQGVNVGVDAPGGSFASYSNGSNASDVDLLSIANGASINNVSKYIITFIPISDTLRFRYAFASEEYPEWVCSNFNDIFGFFISGPGITGPYENNGKNIALIPGTNLPVRINNVNPGVVGSNGSIGNCSGANGSLAYSQFYNDNNGSAKFPVYDGITDVFTAEAVVQPCQVYTIKLVIADVSDSAFDSGVFLEAKSFGTGSLQVETATLSLDGSIAEGCASGSITFSLPNPTEADFPIDFNLSGTAQNGIDYETIPTNLFIPAGSNSITISLTGIEDGIDEGDETIIFDVQRDICHRDTFTILLRENPLIDPDLGPDQTICQGDSVQLDGTIPIVLPDPPSFTNSTPVNITPFGTAIYSDIQVNGVAPTILGPDVIQSICIDSLAHRWIDDLDIYLIGPDGQFLELTTDNGGNGGNGAQLDYYLHTCFTPTATVPINFPGPLAPPTAVPFTGEFLPEGVFSDLWDGVKQTNGTWRLLLYDDANGFEGTLYQWTITFNSIYEIKYDWSPAAGLSCTDCPDPVAKPDQTTTYTVTATDSYGCSVSQSVTIEVEPVYPAPVVTCGTPSNSTVQVIWDPIPGAAGFEVQVNGGPWEAPTSPLSHQVNGVAMGESVEISVRAVGGCGGPATTVQCVAQDCSPPDAAVEKTDITCAGAGDGTVTVLPATGTAPFSFQLAGQTNDTGLFTGLDKGAYTGVLRDAIGCALIFNVVINEPEPLNAAAIIAEPVDCNGAATGAAAAVATGGTGPYAFAWSDLSPDSLNTNLAAGVFEVTITDANGCEATASIGLDDPPAIAVDAVVADASCFGLDNGSAELAISGGVSPYAVAWDAAAQNQATETAVGLPAGQYSAIIRDANGCEVSKVVDIGEPEAIDLAVSGTNALCSDSNDGAVSAIVSGGTGNLTLTWTTDTGTNIGDTPDVSGLQPGRYIAGVLDENQCEARDSVEITAPALLAVVLATADPACAGAASGTAEVQITGGTAPYEVDWGNGFVSDLTRNDLSAGAYNLQIRDANGCTASNAFSLTDPGVLTADAQVQPVSCQGAGDGAITLTAAGGDGNYSFEWEGGATGPSIAGLNPGPTGVTVSDGMGCQVEFVFVVDEPDPLAVTIDLTNPDCNGASNGSAAATVTGGNGAYTYQWDNNQTGPAANGLPAGAHQVTITDNGGCTEIRDFTLQEPAALSATISTTMASCRPSPDGTASVVPAGGTPPYNYHWEDGQTAALASALLAGPHSVTVSDAHGCAITLTGIVDAAPPVDLSLSAAPVLCYGMNQGAIMSSASGGTGVLSYAWSQAGLPAVPNLTNLSAGTYTLTVTDEQGCMATAGITITQPEALSATPQATQVICEGDQTGSIDVAVSGGTGPYQYAWSNGATTEDISGLQVGQYVLTVTDANQCQTTTNSTILQPDPLKINIVAKPADCFGATTGAVQVQTSGGAAPYSFSWNNGTTTEDLTGIPAGNYTLEVTDNAGCSAVREVSVTQPAAPVEAQVETLDVSCAGGRDGRIDLDATGGTGPYAYSFNGIDFNGNSGRIGLVAGVYPVIIKDAHGCIWQGGPVEVKEPQPLVLDLGPDQTIAYGEVLNLPAPAVSGGTGPGFQYAWTPRDTSLLSCFDCPSPVITIDYQTSFILVVTDEAGCETEDVLTVFVQKNNRVFVPTGFTPNNDGTNDRLLVHARADNPVEVVTFRVFDRWGELVYEDGGFMANDPDRGWDGAFRQQPMNSGVFLWSLEVQYQDGNRESFKGSTTLIR